MPTTKEQQALRTVTGVHGKTYPAGTIEAIDQQLRFLTAQIRIAGEKAPASRAWMRDDQNRLLDRRAYLLTVAA